MARDDTKRAQYTELTGAEIKKCLAKLGVSVGKFQRDTGRNEVTITRWLSGKEDGELPLWIELVLRLYYIDQDSRTKEGPVYLPFDEWGIDIEEGDAA